MTSTTRTNPIFLNTRRSRTGLSATPQAAEFWVTATILAVMGVFVGSVACHQAPAALSLLLG